MSTLSHDRKRLDNMRPLLLLPDSIGSCVGRALLPVPLSDLLIPLSAVVGLDVRQGGAGDPDVETYQLCPAQIKLMKHISEEQK